ncbi:metal ABC transporter ATP-binding protein [Candidatus Parcubacteria bacterium]|nr:MAG: metal ABC transporter ATP-binding protein [Candidatus Parcubacteria bacterium]
MKEDSSIILAVKNLDVRFENDVVLRDVSFGISRGESLAIIGPNGSGKTVLLKTLLGMFPHEGTISLAPNVRIGYVPQKIEADKHLPLNFKNLLQAKAEILKLPGSEIASTIDAVGLTAFILETPVGHLSGGHFQRCLIAFALLGRPNMLLFDEPTASIDLPGEEEMYELIHRLQEKYKLTAIIVSHDLSFVYRYATKVLCLNRRNICFGEPRDVLDTHTLEKLYGRPSAYYKHAH